MLVSGRGDYYPGGYLSLALGTGGNSLSLSRGPESDLGADVHADVSLRRDSHSNLGRRLDPLCDRPFPARPDGRLRHHDGAGRQRDGPGPERPGLSIRSRPEARARLPQLSGREIRQALGNLEDGFDKGISGVDNLDVNRVDQGVNEMTQGNQHLTSASALIESASCQ
jgi:hypothetical protein